MKKKGSSHTIDKIVKFNIDDPIYQVHEYSIDAKTNQIYLMGEWNYVMVAEADVSATDPGVEYSMSSRFIRNLNLLMRRNNDPILIHMKTCGGDWQEGMAVYDMIKSCPNPITILSYTNARSMSSIILQAANKRVLMPHSTFMFHEGTADLSGTVKQAETEIIEIKIAKEIMINLYTDVMKKQGKLKRWSRKRIKEWLTDQIKQKEDVYMNAKQSVQYGFADEVFGQDGTYNWKQLLEYTSEQLEVN